MVCKEFLNKGTRVSLCKNCLDSLNPEIIRTIEPFPIISLFEYEQPVIKAVLTAIKFHSNTRFAKEFPLELLTLLRHSRGGGNPVLDFLDPRLRGDDVGQHGDDVGRNEGVVLRNEDTAWIPIPIHSKRLKQRGFNQVDYIFKPLAEYFQIPYIPALKRVKETQALFGLNPEQRHDMVIDAFQLDPEHSSTLKDKHIFIVDDILTTGATIQEAGKCLQNAGVKSLLGFTLAKAIL